MSNRNFVCFWAKNPETRRWTSVVLRRGFCVTLGGNHVETEEGYRCHAHHYTLRGTVVHLEIIEDGCGCVGRVTRYWRGQWTVGGPMERSRDGWMVPKFTETHSSQRDYYAEKAGY